MTAETVMAPDERVFRSHVHAADFVRGVDGGRWRLLRISWPYAWIGVRASPRAGCPDEFVLRFELTNYPAVAPTATPWNDTNGEQLAPSERPKGGRAAMAFRTDWEGGRALYIPCDRVAESGHGQWATWRWDSSKDITLYLRLVHELLNDDDYTGV